MMMFKPQKVQRRPLVLTARNGKGHSHHIRCISRKQEGNVTFKYYIHYGSCRINISRTPSLEQEKAPHDLQSRQYFYRKHRLNNYSWIQRLGMTNVQCSQVEVNIKWNTGKPTNKNNRYKYIPYESPFMVWQVWQLYQLCFQRPIGSGENCNQQYSKYVLAEQKGWVVDWAKYAMKQYLGSAKGKVLEFCNLLQKQFKRIRIQWYTNEVSFGNGGLQEQAEGWLLIIQGKPSLNGNDQKWRPQPQFVGSNADNGKGMSAQKPLMETSCNGGTVKIL